MNGLLSIGPLMWQRLVANWRLLLVLAFGILVASTLMAISPVYTRVMNNLGLQESLEDRLRFASRNGFVMIQSPLGDANAIRTQQELAQLMSEEIGWFIQDEVRYGSLPNMNLVKGGKIEPPPWEPVLLKVQGMTAFDEHVRFIEGRAAVPTNDPTQMEVVLPAETAFYLDASIGETIESVLTYDDCNRPAPTDDQQQAAENRRFVCTPQVIVDAHFSATIVGIVERIDPNDPYWSTGSVGFGRPLATDTEPALVNVVIPETTFFQALPRLLPSFPSEFRLAGLIDTSRLDSANLERAQAALSRVEARMIEVGVLPNLSTAQELASFQNRASFNQVTLLLLLIQVVGIAVYYVMLVSTLLAERRTEEVAMLRSRGATVGQVVAMSAAEALALGLVAAFIAPFVAAAAISALGKTGTFDSISGGAFLPYEVVPIAFLFALGGALIAAVVVVIPAFFGARRGMVVFLRSAARPGKPVLQRYYLDFAIVGLAAFALWQLNQRGSVFDPESVGGWSADPLLLLSPLLLVLAIGAMMFRFLPLILRLVTRVLATTSGPGVTLGLWQLTRSPGRYTQLALLVVMAAAVGTFAATYGETTDRSQEERALYAAGADVRLTDLGRLQRGFSLQAADNLEAVEGVERAATATRQQMTIGPVPRSGPIVSILGIDPARAAEVLWWRDDFAEQPLAQTLRRLQESPIQMHGIALPGEPMTATLWVNPVAARPNITLWLRSMDASGDFRLHELGKLEFEGYQQMTASFEADLRGVDYPISIVSIMMTQGRSLTDDPGEVYMDDLVVYSAAGEPTLVEDFEEGFPWQVLRTPTRELDTLEQSSSGANSGSFGAKYTFAGGDGAEIRGLSVFDPGIPLAAIASQSFLDRTGFAVGDQIDLVYGQLLVPLTIQDVVQYFPTMYDSSAGYVIVNQADLFYFAGMTGDRSRTTVPTEAWLRLTTDPELRQAVKASFFDSFGIPSSQIIDSEVVLAEVRTDPVVRAGGSGILLVALVAAFAILALGFALTLYLGGQARTLEVSVMRVVGISPRQLLLMISLEYLLIASIGLIIGAIAGLQISQTMLSFLNVTDSGDRVVPDFDLITRWDLLGIAFAAVGVAFLAGVIALALYFLRLPVSRVIRITR